MLHAFNDIPGIGLLFVLAVCGAIADWRYVRKGGVRSGKRDRILVWTLAGVFLGIVLFYEYRLGPTGGTLKSSADFIGELTVEFIELVFIAYEFLRWMVREKHPIIADGPNYRGVRGWLLFFIIYATILKPVSIGYFAFQAWNQYRSEPTHVSFPPLQITWSIRIAISLFGIYSGVALWRVQPGAVRIARAYLLALIFQGGLQLALFGKEWSFLSPFDVLKLWRFIDLAIVAPIGFPLIWYFYFKRSERVAATYPAQLAEK